MSYTLAGARGRVGDHDAVIRSAQEWATTRRSDILLADASVVFGRDHLESAALHAERARTTDTMVSRSVAMEALLYLSGRRQVADAIEAAGIRDGTEAIAVVIFGDASGDDFLAQFGWSRDDNVLSPSGKDPGVLGILDAERTTVPVTQITELALERTALVDVMK